MHLLWCCVHPSGVPLGVKIRIGVFLKMNDESEQIISILSCQSVTSGVPQSCVRARPI